MHKRKLNQKRHFSEQIRKQAVEEFRSGEYTVKELADLYHCAPQTIYRWIYKYSSADSPRINVVEMSESTDQRLEDLKNRIAQLERMLGQKQIKVDFLEKMIELAEQEYDLDLKKNFSGTRSNGSEPTGQR